MYVHETRPLYPANGGLEHGDMEYGIEYGLCAHLAELWLYPSIYLSICLSVYPSMARSMVNDRVYGESPAGLAGPVLDCAAVVTETRTPPPRVPAPAPTSQQTNGEGGRDTGYRRGITARLALSLLSALGNHRGHRGISFYFRPSSIHPSICLSVRRSH